MVGGGYWRLREWWFEVCWTASLWWCEFLLAIRPGSDRIENCMGE
jgi:hypothetical protein